MPWYVNCCFPKPPRSPGKASSLWYINLLVAVGTLVVSCVLETYLGKKLRMPDHGWKIGLILFSLFASVAILVLGPD